MDNQNQVAVVVKFTKLPSTPEKIKIMEDYMEDQISRYEFFEKALEYLTNHEKESE